uniref:Dolichyl-diphosphooligosaccharide--protein glycosyltransferase subunit 2 n=1 Tax=Crassostrea virginica TaxID=6565 RepID=A0A8B8ANI1_CRAVI|nr:dolichyl-diphosphooligosaccharide--protein glycosyltransferase subunit 2-like isoform X2 [Crassostrea virginica]
MAKVTPILYLFAVAVLGQALTPSTFLTTIDQDRLKKVFKSSTPYTDLPTVHYSILGLKLLGDTSINNQEICSTITKLVDNKSVASLYHASAAAKGVGNCKFPVGDAQKVLSDAIKDSVPVADIFYAFSALKNLGLQVDNAKVTSALTEALKKDDSAQSAGYGFFVASQLTGDTKKIFDSIEDIVAQADEVDDKYLQFEGGLYTTALVVDGAYKLAAKEKKAPTMSDDKVVKFANYFLSRKHVHQLRAAYQLVSVIKTLTDNPFHIPVAITLASPVAVTSSSPNVQIQVTNLLGGSIGSVTVTADSAKHISSEAIVLSKKPFTAKDSSTYELNFMQSKPVRGFYKLTISAKPSKEDKKLLGLTGAEVDVKVTTQVSIENVEIGVADKDQTTAARTTKVQYPSKASSQFEADYHQKIIIKFQLKDKADGSKMSAHQTFLKLTNQKTNQEIIFVADAASNKFDLDIGNSASQFGYLSGKYSMELIIGDAVIENPFSWVLGDVSLNFPEGQAPKDKGMDRYAKKPEIKHLFREPEKRPPVVVSTVFTSWSFFTSSFLLLQWMKIGVNVSNFPMSLSALGFHLCLAAIFGLYYCYWVQLNMFQTARYLGLLALPTFIFGNRLLSGIASKRKGEKKV